jgi:phage gp36-like protein
VAYGTLAGIKKQIPEKKIIELTNDAGAGPPKKIAYTSGGTYEIVAGDTIVQGSTHALVDEVVLSTGTWAGGDAAGDLYLSDQVGDFAAGNLDVGSHSNAATVAGNSTDTVYAVDTAKVDEAIAKGDGIADAFYGQVTPVPIPAPVPAIVEQNSIIMAIYWLYMRRSAVPEIWRENYKDVMALLKDISTGKASLPPVTEADVAVGQESTITSGERIFTRDKMKGF